MAEKEDVVEPCREDCREGITKCKLNSIEGERNYE